MIFDTLAELLGLSDKDGNQIEIKKVLDDAELRQGTQYLNDKKTIAKDIEKRSLLMESFEPNKELWKEGGKASNSLQSLAKSQMIELSQLEQKFQSLLSQYSTLSNVVYQDEIKFLNREMSKYVGENIRFPGGEIYHVNSFGQARYYPSNETWDNKGANCPSEFTDVGDTSLPELGLTRGQNMYDHEPCGYDGKIVKIGEQASSKINLCRLGNAIASQSSNFNSENSYPAHNAIDGDVNTFNHTSKGAGVYWQVQLGQNSVISNINIYNRRDCCQNRFTKVQLDILDENQKSVFTTTINRSVDGQSEFQVSGINKTGRYVRLTQMEDNYLHMGEVEVIGTYEERIGGSVGYVTSDGLLRPYQTITLII